jgi:hypothetical protein
MQLYHFTDPRNLESIRLFGLMSWQQLIQRDIGHFPGSDNDSRRIDARKCLENYVHLCLFPEHSMAELAVKQKRIESFLWLTIDCSVIRIETTQFSDQNATANAAIINHDPQTALASKNPRAEVLVEGSIDLRCISFPSEVQTGILGKNDSINIVDPITF